VPVIDADTHVDETEDTWEHVLEEDLAYKPYMSFPSNPDPSRPVTRYWMIDGRRQLRRPRDDKRTGTTVETRELLDVSARLRAMDELGIDVQVLYPTTFLTEATERPEVELAVRRAYNRWLADRCAESRGRLRWVCLPPMMNMDKALEELRFAKDNGACGVLKKGDREADKWAVDEYFFPLYEEAERLDLPICFHLGSGTPDFTPNREVNMGGFLRLTLPVVHACHGILSQGITQKFPTLRFGFIEAGASWLPFVLNHLERTEAVQRGGADGSAGEAQRSAPSDILKQNRIYVSIEVNEDLPYLISVVGDDNLVVGSDYTHADQSQELNFRQRLQERADRGEISQTAVLKIVYDNPRALYGL
jgi:uncharacterized protein